MARTGRQPRGISDGIVPQDRQELVLPLHRRERQAARAERVPRQAGDRGDGERRRGRGRQHPSWLRRPQGPPVSRPRNEASDRPSGPLARLPRRQGIDRQPCDFEPEPGGTADRVVEDGAAGRPVPVEGPSRPQGGPGRRGFASVAPPLHPSRQRLLALALAGRANPGGQLGPPDQPQSRRRPPPRTSGLISRRASPLDPGRRSRWDRPQARRTRPGDALPDRLGDGVSGG